MAMDNLRDKKLLAKKSSERFTALTQVATRLGTWAAVAAGAVLALWLLHMGTRRLFFTDNPHFSLQTIAVTIESGTVTPTEIRDRLELTLGEHNVYAIDLAQIRTLLLQDPTIRQAEVRRVLPDTLAITVWGRTPVAQMLKSGGAMLDAEGFVLPAATRPEHRRLPIVTPFDPDAPYAVGDQVTEPVVRDALALLQYIAKEPNGNWFDIKLVQIQAPEGQLMVYLRANANRFIRENAVLILPTTDVATAVDHCLWVVADRSRSHQPTGEINATYDRVAVKP
jgi:cell division septal protein FtsQ